jgi:predicted nucleotidyltransferase
MKNVVPQHEWERQSMPKSRLTIPKEPVADFCRRWDIREFALFGSVVRPDFRDDSDVDVLVSFGPNAHWTLLDCVRMERELGAIFGRPVDLVTRRAIEQSANPIRRRHILESAEPVDVAR